MVNPCEDECGFCEDCRSSLRGDANLDHDIDAKDAALIARYSSTVAGLAPGDDEPLLSATDNERAKQVADVNNDGVIDAKDASLIAKYSSYYSTYSNEYTEAEKYYEIWLIISN